MRKNLFLLPLLALAACATPRESCISEATRELRTLTALVNETQGNIARGYAIAEVQDVAVRRTRCTGTNADGSTFTFPCEETTTVTRQQPVAIDLRAERAKLDSLLERQALLRRQSDAQVQACIAAYPE